jgi:hypothetical protein
MKSDGTDVPVRTLGGDAQGIGTARNDVASLAPSNEILQGLGVSAR